MLTVKKMISSSFIKPIVAVAALVFASASIADGSQSVELAQVSEGFNAEQKYMASCFACHSTGAAGAPKVGDGMAAEWEPRLEKGLDAVVANAINGINTMPAKGLCFDCTDDDLKALVEYMIETSQ
ncbi:MAG: c-type cytochrome [Gammaproteobacteria bacterium]|nr:c-type cytochrome [Gammaproteobacteria bacterium]